eukprot:CAMPEP_0202858920 /NCGR_PEP_ID=MMETSP1391-20130828/1254_1 /ASSEMBLY_ACC=CAM_ASM_000867 /TAXON_ID=1034604 /ORGANISM="Chlamydomonas leiostraca, Strain SAG 11-49" /LENGTH=508 /DNA_ID=CAMNT_0049537899 /DNA_START=249 /DNA_END=1777 /DNA_ORIENTATION=-
MSSQPRVMPALSHGSAVDLPISSRAPAHNRPPMLKPTPATPGAGRHWPLSSQQQPQPHPAPDPAQPLKYPGEQTTEHHIPAQQPAGPSRAAHSASTSHHARVVRAAVRAGVVRKVEARKPALAAVVAQHLLHAARVLGWQALRREKRVEHLEVHAHVAHRLGAQRARVVVARVLGEALAVQQVAARQLLDGVGRVEQVLGAHGAVALHGALAALVRLEHAQRHARVARHAVEEVDAQPAPAPAHVAEGAVVNVPARLVVQQVADGTVVPRRARGAAGARRAHGPAHAARHAHHLAHRVAVHAVRHGLVMAQPAGEHAVAARRHQLRAALVVLAAKDALGCVVVGLGDMRYQLAAAMRVLLLLALAVRGCVVAASVAQGSVRTNARRADRSNAPSCSPGGCAPVGLGLHAPLLRHDVLGHHDVLNEVRLPARLQVGSADTRITAASSCFWFILKMSSQPGLNMLDSTGVIGAPATRASAAAGAAGAPAAAAPALCGAASDSVGGGVGVR